MKKLIVFFLLVCASAQANEEFSIPFIVGGTDVNASDPIASMTVALSDGTSLCTASLVAEDLAVTAAHCLLGGSHSLALVFGLNIKTATQAIRVDGQAYHEEYPKHYSDEQDTYDIGLVHFSGGLPSGYHAASILRGELKDGENVVLAGYGISNGVAETGAGVLRKVSVPIANASFGKTEVLLDQNGGKGACHGDSGGPAFVARGGIELWGVTNRGHADPENDCTHYSVYTDIRAYKAWLKSTAARLRGQ